MFLEFSEANIVLLNKSSVIPTVAEESSANWRIRVEPKGVCSITFEQCQGDPSIPLRFTQDDINIDFCKV